MPNDALINTVIKDGGVDTDWVEITETWDLNHPDCPFVRFDQAKEIATIVTRKTHFEHHNA